MPEFYVKTKPGGKVQGPFTGAQLRKLKAQGRLRANHLVSKDRERWSPCGRVKGLGFAEGGASKKHDTPQTIDTLAYTLAEDDVRMPSGPVSSEETEFCDMLRSACAAGRDARDDFMTTMEEQLGARPLEPVDDPRPDCASLAILFDYSQMECMYGQEALGYFLSRVKPQMLSENVVLHFGDLIGADGPYCGIVTIFRKKKTAAVIAGHFKATQNEHGILPHNKRFLLAAQDDANRIARTFSFPLIGMLKKGKVHPQKGDQSFLLTPEVIGTTEWALGREADCDVGPATETSGAVGGLLGKVKAWFGVAGKHAAPAVEIPPDLAKTLKSWPRPEYKSFQKLVKGIGRIKPVSLQAFAGTVGGKYGPQNPLDCNIRKNVDTVEEVLSWVVENADPAHYHFLGNPVNTLHIEPKRNAIIVECSHDDSALDRRYVILHLAEGGYYIYSSWVR
jgi:hypothetical protein